MHSQDKTAEQNKEEMEEEEDQIDADRENNGEEKEVDI